MKKKEKLALGVDVGGTNLKCALINESGKVLILRKARTEVEKGRNRILENIKALVRETLKERKLTPKDLTGMGLGTPGYVVDGVVYGSPNMPGWHGTPIVDIMKAEFRAPFFASNDVTLAALAEYRYGQKGAVRNMVLYALGTGIGGGIIINGEVYEGSYGMAGELGHVIVAAGGRLCGCGVRGCVEAYASATAIKNMAQELITSSTGGKSLITEAVKGNADKVTPRIVYDAAKAGDVAALEINEIVCRHLAVAVSGAISIFNPELVVLGGGVMQAGDIIMNKVREYLPRFTLADPLSRCRLDYAKLGEDAGAIGCGALVFDRTGKTKTRSCA